MSDDREPERMSEEAARLARVGQNATPEEWAEIMQWLRQSPTHVREFMTAESLNRALSPEVLRALPPIAPVGDPAIEPDAPEFQPKQRPRGAARLWRAAIALAAVVLLIVGFFVGVQPNHTIQTDAGQWYAKTLKDGSSVTVGPRTHLVVELDAQRRSIVLDRGEALFEVEKDPAHRPFVVIAGATRVLATGTRFQVARHNDDLVVTLDEGEVVIERGNVLSPAAERTTLSAGQQATISGARIDVRAVNTQEVLAWTRRESIYYQGPAAQVAEEFNRRNRLRIVIDAPELAARPIKGILRADNPEALASSLARSGPYEVQREGDVLHIKRVAEPSRGQVTDHGR